MQEYLTTPIYYLNGLPHIGHAYTTIVGDVFKKFEQMRGNSVYYSTGTDEHGQKNQHSIEASGKPAEEFLQAQSDNFRNLFVDMGIDFDFYVRTSRDDHKKIVQEILTNIYNQGMIIKKSYAGLYCEGCEQFKKKTDLDETGCCPDHKVAPKEITEENYFFRLEPYRQWLIDYIKANPSWIQPANFAKEVLGMLNEPLEDLCISRPKARVWLGVDLPFDKDYVNYIWFDALVNYISTLNYGHNPDFKKIWENSNHLIGKDIIKPHCIYWPIMLKAMGEAPVKHYFVHGFWIGEGGVKMSKSLGNVVDPIEVINLLGVDALRFYLINNMGINSDSQISLDLLKHGYKLLANNIGNLQMRVLKMAQKSLDAKVPDNSNLTDDDKKLIEETANTFSRIYSQDMSLEAISELAASVVKAGDAANAYFAANTPWVLAKDENQKERFEAVVYTTLEMLRLIGIASYPLIPNTAEKILHSLGVNNEIRAEFKPLRLPTNNELTVGDPLFPMLEA